MARTRISGEDALLVVDVQNGFCPGGALPGIPVLNRWMQAANARRALIRRVAGLASG